MNNFEKLWQAFSESAQRDEPLPPGQLLALRKAFFAGGWCQMNFTRRIRGLDVSFANELLEELEWELAREMRWQPGRTHHKPDAANRTDADVQHLVA